MNISYDCTSSVSVISISVSKTRHGSRKGCRTSPGTSSKYLEIKRHRGQYLRPHDFVTGKTFVIRRSAFKIYVSCFTGIAKPVTLLTCVKNTTVDTLRHITVFRRSFRTDHRSYVSFSTNFQRSRISNRFHLNFLDETHLWGITLLVSLRTLSTVFVTRLWFLSHQERLLSFLSCLGSFLHQIKNCPFFIS